MFDAVRAMVKEAQSVIFVSHRLDEVLDSVIALPFSVMGRWSGEAARTALTSES